MASECMDIVFSLIFIKGKGHIFYRRYIISIYIGREHSRSWSDGAFMSHMMISTMRLRYILTLIYARRHRSRSASGLHSRIKGIAPKGIPVSASLVITVAMRTYVDAPALIVIRYQTADKVTAPGGAYLKCWRSHERYSSWPFDVASDHLSLHRQPRARAPHYIRHDFDDDLRSQWEHL